MQQKIDEPSLCEKGYRPVSQLDHRQIQCSMTLIIIIPEELHKDGPEIKILETDRVYYFNYVLTLPMCVLIFNLYY